MNDYGVDLARIHHQGYDDLARRAGPAIVRHLREAEIRGGLIVDLGCGSGILARYLSDRGYQVLGIDPSSAMLRIARRIAPAARFIQKRAEEVTLPSCMAVIATGEALTYLPARTAPMVHLRHHIHRVSNALIPGGLFMFDVITEGRSASMTYRTSRAVTDWAVLAAVAEDRRQHVVTRRITTFARVGSSYRRSYTEHRVGVYRPGGVLRELRACGFVAHTLYGYGEVPPLPRRRVFHAQFMGS